MLFVLLLELISYLSVERRNRDKLRPDRPLGSNADFFTCGNNYKRLLLPGSFTACEGHAVYRDEKLASISKARNNFSAFEVLETSFWCFAFFPA